MPKYTPSSSVRRPWIATAVQGWGQEIVATFVSFIVLLTSAVIVSWGPYFVLGCAVFVLWRRPDIRRRLMSDRQHRAAIRRVHAALWLCMVVGRDGRIPQVKRFASTPVGCRYLLLLPIGLHFEAMEARAPELCATGRSLERSSMCLVHPLTLNLNSNSKSEGGDDMTKPGLFRVSRDTNMDVFALDTDATEARVPVLSAGGLGGALAIWTSAA